MLYESDSFRTILHDTNQVMDEAPLCIMLFIDKFYCGMFFILSSVMTSDPLVKGALLHGQMFRNMSL